MSEQLLALEEFLKLDSDDQVEKLKRWKMNHTLKDIREAWNFKHSAQYYMLLKKLRIYERVINKSDKFYPQAESQRMGTEGVWRSFGNSGIHTPSDHFNFHLNSQMTGTQLADKLERIAFFLRGESKEVDVKISIVMTESTNEQ